MRSGFTLVELSIVLVIVGLLVGGILVGQSLIDSARVNRLVSDLRQYEIAVVQFRSKFKQYPGDSSYFTPPGNPDGALSNGGNGGNPCAAVPNTTLNNDEPLQVWAHLSQAKMLSKNYVAYSPISCGGNHSNNYYDTSLAGVVWPYTELNSTAASAVSIVSGLPLGKNQL